MYAWVIVVIDCFVDCFVVDPFERHLSCCTAVLPVKSQFGAEDV